MSSDTLTATAGGAHGVHLVVNADGSWTFDLDDQLDHVDDGRTPRTWRCSLVGGGSVNAIDFSSMIVATDADGDEVPGAASGSFTVAVQDDIPVQVTTPTPVAATVEEDGMDAAVVAPEGLNGIDLSTGNKEVGDTNADDEASGGLGSLSGLFSVGADEPLTISLSTTTSGICRRCCRRARRSPMRSPARRHADGDGGRPDGVHLGGERGRFVDVRPGRSARSRRRRDRTPRTRRCSLLAAGR